MGWRVLEREVGRQEPVRSGMAHRGRREEARTVIVLGRVRWCAGGSGSWASARWETVAHRSRLVGLVDRAAARHIPLKEEELERGRNSMGRRTW